MLGPVWVLGGTHEATFLSVSRGWLAVALSLGSQVGGTAPASCVLPAAPASVCNCSVNRRRPPPAS